MGKLMKKTKAELVEMICLTAGIKTKLAAVQDDRKHDLIILNRRVDQRDARITELEAKFVEKDALVKSHESVIDRFVKEVAGLRAELDDAQKTTELAMEGRQMYRTKFITVKRERDEMEKKAEAQKAEQENDPRQCCACDGTGENTPDCPGEIEQCEQCNGSGNPWHSEDATDCPLCEWERENPVEAAKS